MKKFSKVLVATMAIALVAAFMPAMTFADTTTVTPVSAKVSVTATTPTGFDLVDKTVTATSDMAETYLGQTEATTAKVTVLDAIVAAHIEKYGDAFKQKPSDYLTMSDNTKAAYVTKLFGHSLTNFIFYNGNKAIASGVVTDTVADGDSITACTYAATDTSWTGLYSYFDKVTYSAKAGKTFYVVLNADNWGTSLVTNKSTIQKVNATSGTLTAMSGKTDDHGIASVKFNTPGTYYISAKGTVTYKNYSGTKVKGSIMAPLAKVKVGLSAPKAKASNKTATSVKITWGKVTAASKYNVYRATSKTGTYKCVKTTTGTSFTNKGLKNGKHYYYKVKAVKGTYVSSYSKAVVK